MKIKPRFLVGGGIITASMAYVIYLGASSNWQYYLQVDECIAQADQVRGQRLRVSGRVAAGSLSTAAARREVSFILEGNEKSMPVTYQGPMPDNMAEGKEIVVEGVLQPNGELKGETIITKCASKYASEDAARDAKPAQRAP